MTIFWLLIAGGLAATFYASTKSARAGFWTMIATLVVLGLYGNVYERQNGHALMMIPEGTTVCIGGGCRHNREG